MTRAPDSKMQAAVMSFGDHLEELRRRVLWGLVGIIPIFTLALVFGDWLIEVLMAPVQAALHRAGLPQALQSTGPLETIGAYVKITLAVTLVLGLPWIIYQLWLFVAPGLHAHERRFAQLLLPMSAVLSLGGLAFLYFVMLPAMLFFLVTFGAGLGRPTIIPGPLPPGIVLPTVPTLDADPVSPPPGSQWYNRTLGELRFARPDSAGAVEVVGAPMGVTAGIAQQYRIGEYTGLVFFLAVAFALGFQTPIVVLLLGWLGIVERRFLTRNRKYAVFIAAVAAALLTPTPDPISMTVLAVPLYLLFELGLIMLKFLPPGRVARGFTWGGRTYGVAEPGSAGDP
ncbi:MAG: preprotein translocase subunit TatC [Phycisphaerales bacterium]|nr:preprotein translocase subunit TatC [Phycisphaerales bacterium]